jgi:hypothetical protein
MRSTAPSVASTAPGNSVTDGDVVNKRRLTADPVSKAEVPMWSSNDLSGLSLNFEYTVRQKLPPRGGNLERHQVKCAVIFFSSDAHFVTVQLSRILSCLLITTN